MTLFEIEIPKMPLCSQNMNIVVPRLHSRLIKKILKPLAPTQILIPRIQSAEGVFLISLGAFLIFQFD
jgi:hypothetical protein